MNEKQFEEKLTLLDQLQSACTHCGLCSEGCATFQSTGWEHESPRGRLQLASQFLHGHIPPQSPALSTFDRCLGCRACELSCPHHVAYHHIRQIVQELRRDLRATPSFIEVSQDHYRYWLKLAGRISHVWWRRYGAKRLKVPSLDVKSSGSFIKRFRQPPPGKPVLAVCCVQDLFQHEVIEQTLTFMHRLGCPLEVDRNQPCCGALFERLVHGGEESVCDSKTQRKAASLQGKTCAAFLKWMPSQTYFLSQGCKSFVAGQNVSVLNIYARIEELLDQKQLKLQMPQSTTVYYQPYCGSRNEEQDVVLRLLRRIQGLIVHEVSGFRSCCGGYCGETLLHQEHAQGIAKHKISQLPRGAIVVVTSVDCWGLFKKYSADGELVIYYPIQLLESCIGAVCKMIAP